ncbi:GILT-like protein 1, partial [Pseudolycoriella hygida]
MKLFIALLFVCLAAVNAQQEPREQLQVGIYYNSLCSDTARFITDQLLPAYELLSDFIDLVFIPFGKAYSVNNGEFFICQFGPAECYGNMLQLFNMKLFIALVFVCFAAVNAQEEPRNQLHVGVYYNSLCSDTSRFIHDQLVPAYEHLRDYIDLHFIPFGKSFHVDHGDYFLCQFGPDECYGNFLQLCGLNQICRNEQAQVDFVACEMQLPFNRNVTRPQCSEASGIDWDEVTHCIEHGFAHQLKLDAGRQTHRIARPYPNFVPTIVYNGTFDQQLQNRSLREFGRVVCELIDEAAPICPDIPSQSV